MGFIALLVYVKLGRPILFKQTRPGLNGKPFIMYKFRTMLDLRQSDGTLLPNDERLTSFGQKLRGSSLDELPELFNILKGDMSFVGPRPLLMEYLELYTPEQRRRHDVKPGMTGWAQVSGRNLLTWDEKFKYDIHYVENRSFLFDIKIVILTLYRVLTREGVSPKDRPIVKRFQGSKDERNE
jgi:sugar transferase EpsL